MKKFLIGGLILAGVGAAFGVYLIVKTEVYRRSLDVPGAPGRDTDPLDDPRRWN